MIFISVPSPGKQDLISYLDRSGDHTNRPLDQHENWPYKGLHSQGKYAKPITLLIQSLIWNIVSTDGNKIWSMKEKIQMNEQKNWPQNKQTIQTKNNENNFLLSTLRFWSTLHSYQRNMMWWNWNREHEKIKSINANIFLN